MNKTIVGGFSALSPVGLIEGQIRETVARFARVGELLGAVHASLATLTGRLDMLAEMVTQDDDANDPMVETVAALRRLHDLLTGWQTSTMNPRKPEAAQMAKQALLAIRGEAMQLSAIASMTADASASLGAANLGDYVISLKAMASTMDDRTKAVDIGLIEIGHAQTKALRFGVAAVDLLTTSESALNADQVGRARAADAEREARTGIQDLALATRQTARGDIKVLIRAIQFSDSFAQRMDHIVHILEAAEAVGPGRLGDAVTVLPDNALAGTLFRLAGAQCRAAAEEMLVISDTARAALTQMARIGRHLQGQFGVESTGHAGQKLAEARETALQAAIAPLHVVRPAVATARAEVGRVERRVATATAQFEELRRVFVDVRLSGINATLLSARSGTGRAALAVLATAVQQAALNCETDMSLCEVALQQLAQEQGAAHLDAMGTAAEDFDRSVAECSAQLQQSRERLDRLISLKTEVSEIVTTLVVAADDSCAELGRITQLAEAMLTLSREIGSRFGDTISIDPYHPTLRALFDGYTMRCEREVQTALLGTPDGETAAQEGAPNADVQVPASDLDSIFF